MYNRYSKTIYSNIRTLKDSEFLFFNNIIDIKEESEQYYHQPGDMWPDLETIRKMPFDYTIHDPKYEDASLICSKLQTINSEGKNFKILIGTHVCIYLLLM